MATAAGSFAHGIIQSGVYVAGFDGLRDQIRNGTPAAAAARMMVSRALNGFVDHVSGRNPFRLTAAPSSRSAAELRTAP
jgi:hypothetical protein